MRVWMVRRGEIGRREGLPDLCGECRRGVDVTGGAQLDQARVPLRGQGAFVGGEAQALGALQDRLVLGEDRRRRAVARSGDRDGVESGIGIHRCVEVSARLRGGELRVRGAHLVEVGCREVRHRRPDGQGVHRRHDCLRVANGGGFDRCDDGGPPRGRADETRAREFEEGLAHRCAADAEACGELAIAQLLAGSEGPVHDGVLQPCVHVLTQEVAGEGRGREGHDMQYIAK